MAFLFIFLMFVFEAQAQICSSDLRTASGTLQESSCEINKSLNCQEFYSNLNEESLSRLALQCPEKQVDLSATLNCSGLAIYAGGKGYQKLSSQTQKMMVQKIPQIVQKLGPRFLSILSGLGIASTIYTAADFAMDALESDRQCFKDNDSKQMILNSVYNQSQFVQKNLQKHLNSNDLRSISFSKNYLDMEFIKNLTCQQLKDLLLQQKRKEDIALGPLVAQKKISIDPRKLYAKQISENQMFFDYFQKSLSCIDPSRKAEVICALGNSLLGVQSLTKYFKGSDKKFLNSLIQKQRLQALLDQKLVQPLPVRKIDPLDLNDDYYGEEVGKSMAFSKSKVKYMNAEERKGYLLKAQNGLFLDPRGKAFSTTGARSLHSSRASNRAMFVVDMQGNMYASNMQIPGKLHHSSFVAGEPVLMAGEIEIKNGKVIYFSRRSGHYEPTTEHSKMFLEYLKTQGFDVSEIKVDDGF